LENNGHPTARHHLGDIVGERTTQLVVCISISYQQMQQMYQLFGLNLAQCLKISNTSTSEKLK